MAIKAGVVGCGTISPVYFEASRRFEAVEIVACADMDTERARCRAREVTLVFSRSGIGFLR